MLYEILKSAKLGAATAPDMFTGLLAQKMKFAKGSGEIAELSGVLPLTFKANGQPLLDWKISGNIVQNGTPTPANPVFVQGVGELDGGNWKIPISCGNQTTNVNLAEVQSERVIQKLVLSSTGNFWKNYPNNPDDYMYYMTTGNKQSKDIVCTHLKAITNYPLGTTIGCYGILNGFSLTIYLNFGADIMNAQASGNTVAGLKEYFDSQQALGAPVAIFSVSSPVVSAIVNKPLQKIGTYADTISMTDTGIEIPTVRGNNVLTVDTTVQPSVYIKYKK